MAALPGRGYSVDANPLLAKLSEDVITVGLGFETQMYLPVPVDPHDWPVQALLSERGLHILKTED